MRTFNQRTGCSVMRYIVDLYNRYGKQWITSALNIQKDESERYTKLDSLFPQDEPVRMEGV